jgi:hypothetical protein
MKKTALFTAVVFFSIIGSIYATDMTLILEDRREVILHDDKTWGFAKFTITEGEQEDIYSTLNDGRIICLKGDNTWSFVKKQPPAPKKKKPLSAVSAQGTATKPTLDQAVQAASAEAIRHAVILMRPFVPVSKMTDKYLTACIKNQIGESGVETSYTPGWNANAKVSIDILQVKKIVECVEDQLAPEPTAPADTSKAKSGKTPSDTGK